MFPLHLLSHSIQSWLSAFRRDSSFSKHRCSSHHHQDTEGQHIHHLRLSPWLRRQQRCHLIEPLTGYFERPRLSGFSSSIKRLPAPSITEQLSPNASAFFVSSWKLLALLFSLSAICARPPFAICATPARTHRPFSSSRCYASLRTTSELFSDREHLGACL